MLEGFQAGLAWITVLRKRDAFRKAFRGFDPARVARFGEPDMARLLDNEGIIRSRAKIDATIAGARIYEEMKRNGEDFSRLFGTWPEESRSKTKPDRYLRRPLFPKRSRQRSRSEASNLSGPSSSTPGCKPRE